MLTDGTIYAKNVWDEVVVNDAYRIGAYAPNAFDSILDIGANVGTFAIHAGRLFPGVPLLAIEPCFDTCGMLTANTLHLPSVTCRRLALGVGGAMMEVCRDAIHPEHNGVNQCQPATTENAETVCAIGYWSLRAMLPNSKDMLVKVDCEGGEVVLEDNKDFAADMFSGRIKHLAMEIHYPPWVSWGLKYTAWLEWTRRFANTHSIESSTHESDGLLIFRRK